MNRLKKNILHHSDIPDKYLCENCEYGKERTPAGSVICQKLGIITTKNNGCNNYKEVQWKKN